MSWPYNKRGLRKWSSLTYGDRREWLDKARKAIYHGLEPWTEEKERAIPAKARELYYAAELAEVTQ